MTRVELVHDARTDLGEGVVWSPVENLLLWNDVTRGDVYRYHPDNGPVGLTHFADTVGCVLPRRNGGWALGLGREVALTDSSDEIVERIELPGALPNHRANDGAVDPCGRLFQGTMTPLDAREPTAHLYRVDPDRAVQTVLDGVTISNGIGWSPDRTRMYYVDTEMASVDIFDYEVDSGEISDRRPLVGFDRSSGRPDGLTVDRDGCIWIAFYWGGCVRRISPSGEVLDELQVGVPSPTSCTFGGPDLDTLYISTASHRHSPDALRDHPTAGGLFAADVDAIGQPPTLFEG